MGSGGSSEAHGAGAAGEAPTGKLGGRPTGPTGHECRRHRTQSHPASGPRGAGADRGHAPGLTSGPTFNRPDPVGRSVKPAVSGGGSSGDAPAARIVRSATWPLWNLKQSCPLCHQAASTKPDRAPSPPYLQTMALLVSGAEWDFGEGGGDGRSGASPARGLTHTVRLPRAGPVGSGNRPAESPLPDEATGVQAHDSWGPRFASRRGRAQRPPLLLA